MFSARAGESPGESGRDRLRRARLYDRTTPIVGRVHPRQPELPDDVEQVLIAALADAEINLDDALLYLLDGEQGSNGYEARYLHRGLHINAEGEAEEIHPLLDEMNDDACIDAYRIVVFRDRNIEGIAALIRHELEHARQRDAHGQRLMELYGIAENVLSERVGGLTGGGFLYQTIPVEMDANAAAATFVRARYGAVRIDELLSENDKTSAAFRSLVGPPPLDTLPDRMIRYFATIPDLCERFVEQRTNYSSFPELLNIHAWRGAGDVYERLLEDENLRLN
jgi:hypothetical protein